MRHRFRGPVCPDWLQEQLLTWMIESAERGRPGFKEMLTMTPCDLFSLIRGRTLWLMGDSMMQVPGQPLYFRPSLSRQRTEAESPHHSNRHFIWRTCLQTRMSHVRNSWVYSWA